MVTPGSECKVTRVAHSSRPAIIDIRTALPNYPPSLCLIVSPSHFSPTFTPLPSLSPSIAIFRVFAAARC